MGRSPQFGDPASLSGSALAPPASLWTRARDAFRQEAKEFCLFTGLHGYKYIVQPGKRRSERLFWVLVVTLSMAAAVVLMFMAYEFNRNHPTILAVDSTHYPLWRVGAPGVTVCPSIKVLRSKALRIVRGLTLPPNVTEEDVLSDMGYLVELIAPRANNASQLERLQSILDKNSLSVDAVMRQVTPTCDEMLVRCTWKRRQCVHCSDIFRLVRTAYGYCCSFNYIDKDFDDYRPRMGGCVGWSYKEIQRLSACGYTNGLSVTVRVNPNESLSSFLASHAVLVMIHNPAQWPDGNADIKVVAAGTVAFISYLAQVTEASARLAERLAPNVRKCQFIREIPLPMFGRYTFENCMASCQANKTLRVCGCVPLTYPHVFERKICNLMDTPCVAAIATGSREGHQPVNASMCPLCEPLCEKVEYTVETSIGKLDWSDVADGDTLIKNLDGDEMEYAVFHVFPNDLVTTRYKLDMYMTREDLLGSLGGLSGLLVGFSLVSGFEFVYFFTIRPFFRMRARQAAGRAGSPPTEVAGVADPNKHAPFPLAAPHVFRFRRRRAKDPPGSEEHERNGRTGAISMIPVIE